MKRGWMWCVLPVVCWAAPAWAGKAHEHGVARLDVVVEPGRITLQLDTPLDNLLGFERAPRTAAERQRADAAVARLRAADGLFRIDPAAGCTLAGVELQSAALKLGATPGGDAAKDAKDAKGTQDSGHADLDGEFVFNCQAGAKAAHIDVELFGAFPNLGRLNVQLALPGGQRQVTLRKPAKRLTLAR